MDRSRTSAPDRHPAVRSAEPAALHVLLPATAGERGESTPTPAARRTVYAPALLWKPPHGRGTGREPETHPALDAHPGHRSHLPQTEPQPPGARSPDLPLPVARGRDRSDQPGLEHRYYLYSHAWRLSLPGCRHGLVQPLRPQLGTVQHHGRRLLPSGAGGRLRLWSTRDLELRPGVPVHRGRL